MNLNNVMLGTQDPKRLADFYQSVLGAPKAEWGDEANGWFGFQAGNGSLMIGPHSEVSDRSPEPARVMMNFESTDVPADFERIKSIGAEVVTAPYTPEGGEGMQMCTFADPDGNYFQLMPPWEP